MGLNLRGILPHQVTLQLEDRLLDRPRLPLHQSFGDTCDPFVRLHLHDNGVAEGQSHHVRFDIGYLRGYLRGRSARICSHLVQMIRIECYAGT